MLDKSVPCGDSLANKETRKWGDVPKFDFEIKDHIDISENLNLLELERAAKTAGARFYYLKGDLVKLNQSLIQFGLDFLSENGYTMFQPPYMINRKSMEGAVILDDFEDVIYKIEDQDLYLIGTSEHAMVSMHGNEILDGNSLPARYALSVHALERRLVHMEKTKRESSESINLKR